MFSVTKGLFERLRAKMKINLDHIVMKQRSSFLLRVRYWYFKSYYQSTPTENFTSSIHIQRIRDTQLRLDHRTV